MRGCIERTLPAAYSLALRICGDAKQAGAVCERSYAELTAIVTGTAAWSQSDELRFLARVRAHALAGRRESPTGTHGSSVRANRSDEGHERGWQALGAAGALGKQAVELAYFGGMNAASIAELLEEPVETVRAAMRKALLAVAGSEGPGTEHDDEHA